MNRQELHEARIAELERAAAQLRETPDQDWLWSQAYATLGRRVRAGDTILVSPRPFFCPPQLWTLNSAGWWEKTG
jgi:hypothetical protein